MQKLEFVSREPIDKGWSGDKKYCAVTDAGTKYLLRVTDGDRAAAVFDKFHMQKRIAKLGIPMCRPIEIGECGDGVYTVWTWIDGKDAIDFLPNLSDSEKYAYGLEAGRIQRMIHSIPAPADFPDWEGSYNANIDRKIGLYRNCPVKFDGDEAMIEFILANRHLLKGRPQCLRHGDFHRGNLMIDTNGRLTVIDFDKVGYGDPWEDIKGISWDVSEDRSALCVRQDRRILRRRCAGGFLGAFCFVHMCGDSILCYVGDPVRRG